MQSEVRNIEAKRVKGEGDPGSGVRCQGSGTRVQVPGVRYQGSKDPWLRCGTLSGYWMGCSDRVG